MHEFINFSQYFSTMISSLRGLNFFRFESQDVEKKPWDESQRSYLDTHDLLYAPSKRKIKTHGDVETVLRKHNWKPMFNKPVKGWVDYLYDPPNNTDEIQPIACLPAPPPPTFPSAFDLPSSWQLQVFHPSLECVKHFADRVNTIMGDEILVVEERRYFNW